MLKLNYSLIFGGGNLLKLLKLGILNKKFQAFTLTELLIALGVIGAIAAISVPSLMNTINNRMHATQLKNTVASIQQLISDQMVSHKTKNLADTDFASEDKLLTGANFAIVKTCEKGTDASTNCWHTSATDTSKVTYKGMAGNTGNAVADSIASLHALVASHNRTVVLKNGVILAYNSHPDEAYAEGNDKLLGIFFVDLNGTEKPNISGRDFFWLYVTEHGKIVGYKAFYEQNSTLEQMINFCKGGNAAWCFDVVVDSGWKMPY